MQAIRTHRRLRDAAEAQVRGIAPIAACRGVRYRGACPHRLCHGDDRHARAADGRFDLARCTRSHPTGACWLRPRCRSDQLSLRTFHPGLSLDRRARKDKDNVLVDKDVELVAWADFRISSVGCTFRFRLMVRSATRPKVSAKLRRAASEREVSAAGLRARTLHAGSASGASGLPGLGYDVSLPSGELLCVTSGGREGC